MYATNKLLKSDHTVRILRETTNKMRLGVCGMFAIILILKI